MTFYFIWSLLMHLAKKKGKKVFLMPVMSSKYI